MIVELKKEIVKLHKRGLVTPIYEDNSIMLLVNDLRKKSITKDIKRLMILLNNADMVFNKGLSEEIYEFEGLTVFVSYDSLTIIDDIEEE